MSQSRCSHEATPPLFCWTALHFYLFSSSTSGLQTKLERPRPRPQITRGLAEAQPRRLRELLSVGEGLNVMIGPERKRAEDYTGQRTLGAGVLSSFLNHAKNQNCDNDKIYHQPNLNNWNRCAVQIFRKYGTKKYPLILKYFKKQPLLVYIRSIFYSSTDPIYVMSQIATRV